MSPVQQAASSQKGRFVVGRRAIDRARSELELAGSPAYVAVGFESNGSSYLAGITTASLESADSQAVAMSNQDLTADVFVVGRRIDGGRVCFQVWHGGEPGLLHQQHEVIPDEHGVVSA